MSVDARRLCARLRRCLGARNSSSKLVLKAPADHRHRRRPRRCPARKCPPPEDVEATANGYPARVAQEAAVITGTNDKHDEQRSAQRPSGRGRQRKGIGHQRGHVPAIPPAVVTRKVCGGNRTRSGAVNQQLLASAARTARQRGLALPAEIPTMLPLRRPRSSPWPSACPPSACGGRLRTAPPAAATRVLSVPHSATHACPCASPRALPACGTGHCPSLLASEPRAPLTSSTARGPLSEP